MTKVSSESIDVIYANTYGNEFSKEKMTTVLSAVLSSVIAKVMAEHGEVAILEVKANEDEIVMNELFTMCVSIVHTPYESHFEAEIIPMNRFFVDKVDKHGNIKND